MGHTLILAETPSLGWALRCVGQASELCTGPTAHGDIPWCPLLPTLSPRAFTGISGGCSSRGSEGRAAVGLGELGMNQ